MADNVQINDLGWNAYLDRMRQLSSNYVKAGFPEGEQVRPGTRIGSGHEPASSMDELIVIMATHEFGSEDGTIRERSFIRSAIDENRAEIERIKAEVADKVTVDSMTPKRALDLIGIKAVALIRKKIRDLKSPSNKLSTVKRKGSSNPLIDTGQARQTVQHVITGRGLE